MEHFYVLGLMCRIGTSSIPASRLYTVQYIFWNGILRFNARSLFKAIDQ